MANFPMISMNWDLDNSTLFLCNGSRLAIHRDGTMSLEGTTKDAAMALVKYVVQSDLVDQCISMTLNESIKIEAVGKTYELIYLKKDKPEFWDDLVREFNKIIRMKAFW